LFFLINAVLPSCAEMSNSQVHGRTGLCQAQGSGGEGDISGIILKSTEEQGFARLRGVVEEKRKEGRSGRNIKSRDP
jgi:hypothetical protein